MCSYTPSVTVVSTPVFPVPRLSVGPVPDQTEYRLFTLYSVLDFDSSLSGPLPGSVSPLRLSIGLLREESSVRS